MCKYNAISNNYQILFYVPLICGNIYKTHGINRINHRKSTDGGRTNLT